MKNIFFVFFVALIKITLVEALQNNTLELPQSITLGKGEQKTFIIPHLKRVALSNTQIAQVQVLPPGNEIIVQALKEGGTTLTLWTENNKNEISVSIYSYEMAQLKNEVEKLFKHTEDIHIHYFNKKILISGWISDEKTLKLILPLKEQKNILDMTHIRSTLLSNLALKISSILKEKGFLHIQVLAQEETLYLEGKVESQKEYELISSLTMHVYPQFINNISTQQKFEKMILVDVKILEIAKSKSTQVGFDYPDQIRIFSLNNLLRRFSNTSSHEALDVFLHLLSEKGFGKILSNPKLVCRNGEEAQFLVGGEIPIRIISRVTSQITWRSYGIILKIKPFIDSQNRIFTTLNAELSSLDPAHTTDGIPGILSRKVETSLNVHNGETIILSGLETYESSQSESGVPFLSDIPLLGNLLKTQGSLQNKKELIILVTPHLHTKTQFTNLISKFKKIHKP
ncbi:MAG: pilus assembly protein N-terminal domain-containing protein [Deltaproteobacteria bacterium]|nr:pilus assembly protein N-terminal domain-containing protein [Deltaproteobacteria bacterium]